MKAAYRLFDRDEVTHQAVLAPHCQRTRQALRQPGRFLLPGDTTELDFTGHPATEGLGRIGGARDDQGPRGLFLHTSLAVQLLPGPGPDVAVARVVGLAHQVVWARTKPPSKDEHGRRPSPKVRLSQEDRESQRWSAVTDHLEPPPPGTTWVVVQDREGDIYESIIKCINKKISFVIRAKHDRVTADDDAHLFDAVAAASVLGRVAVELPRRPDRPPRTATLTLRALRRRFQTPYRPGGRPAAFEVTVLEAREVDPPAGVAPVFWVLVTDRVVTGVADGAEILNIYARRELIEEFHRVMKSGLGVEKSGLTTARRLEALSGLLSVVATFLLDLSRRGRVAPETPLEPSDGDAVMREVREGHLGPPPSGVGTVDEFLRAVACLGGFPGWNRKRQPGWITIWRGWQRLMVMVQAVESHRRRNTGLDPPGMSE
ncbi:MAG TPA: IS4 family transposase [Isosphaeraceae bacterium]|nr:IS4 family transposase [Isosphaeraceae bacterium]